MNTDLAPAALVEAVEFHLSTDDHQRRALKSMAPLTRAVDIGLRSWEPWLRDGGRPGSASYVGPLELDRVAAAQVATKGMAEIDPGHLVVDRAQLLALSERAAKSNERRCTELWVATMMWGSGTMNGRGPWRTAEALADERLGEVLVASHRRLRAGDLAGAYGEATAITGSAESSFTKWLWAASLAFDCEALIYDDRARNEVNALVADRDVGALRSGCRGYVAYVDVLAATAAIIRKGGLRGATAEKLEWLVRSG